MPDRIRVAVVVGALFGEQLQLFEHVDDSRFVVTKVGTAHNPYSRQWPWGIVPPSSSLSLDAVRLGSGHHLWWYSGLPSALRVLEPHVVHVMMEPWSISVLQTVMSRRRFASGSRRPMVVAHGCDNLYSHGSVLKRGLRRAALKFVLSRLDAFASWNEAGLRLARVNGLPSEVPTLLAPAVVPDPTKFDVVKGLEQEGLRRDLGLPRGLVVGFAGRFVPEKGFLDLVEALRRLGAAAPYLAAWGAGSQRDAYHRAVKAAGVRGQVFAPLKPIDVPRALAACDVVAMPSRTTPTWAEQFGRVAVEAMFCGVPVVAFGSGALPEVVGPLGTVIAEGDVSGLGDAILAAAMEGPSSSLRSAALARYSPRTIASRLEGLWERLAAA